MYKKLSSTLLILLVFCSSAFSGGNRWSSKPPVGSVVDWSHPLSRGLVGAWLMNENGGNIVTDIAGENNGTMTEGLVATYGNMRKVTTKGYGIVFNWNGSNINCGTKSSLDVSSITIMGMFSTRPENTALACSILDRLQSVSPWKGYHFGYSSNTTNKFNFYTSNTNWENTTNSYNDNKFHIATVVNSPSIGAFYVDGKLESNFVDGGSSITSNPGGTAQIGKKYTGASAFGKIVFVYCWNRALSPSEIQQLYQDPYCFIKPPTIWSMFSTAVAAARRRIGLVQ